MSSFKLWLCCFSSSETESGHRSVNSQDLSSSIPPSSSLLSRQPLPSLTLEVIESPLLQVGSNIEVMSTGLTCGRRGVKDGCTYFGAALMRTKSPGNDFVWPSAEEGLGGQHFAIRFEKGHFLLQDMGEGNGTFLRIRQWTPLPTKAVISFEDSHTLCEVLGGSRLKITFVEGPLAEKSFDFSAQDRCIFIGRMTDCRIHIAESHSRYSAVLKHTAAGWMVSDGDGRKASAFGVWLFVDSGVRVTDKCEFKAGQTRFQVTLH